MAQVLYRKYRSKKLDEIVGQEHITKTLSEALKSGRISHAYLFTGPRGVGKTSIARILAHEVNGLEYIDDQPHIDIIEIDAASNRRIDEIRDLREKVHISPASAKYKVYIIDEVHMLTKEAFNALLKTLEEPPAHVIFILATTDATKLPDTIISRTQRFSFKPIEPKSVVDHLRTIADQEKIKINDQALDLIAVHGEGSFRDSISLLDQLSHSTKEITEEDVRRILGIPSAQAIARLIELVDDPSTTYKELADELKELSDQAYSASLLAKRLMNDIRNKLITNDLNMPPAKAINLLKELLAVGSSTDPHSMLLLSLLNNLDYLPPKTAAKTPEKVVSAAIKEETKSVSAELPKEKSKPPAVKVDTENVWPELLSVLKNRYNTLYGIVRMSEPVFKDNELELIFDFAFHKKQVSESKNKQILADILNELTGENFRISTFINEAGRELNIDQPKPAATPTSKDLDNISKIFGGGELVE